MKAVWRHHARAGSGALAGLMVLCFLWSLGALRSDLFPAPISNLAPPIERQALPFAMLAVAAALFALVRGTEWPRTRSAGKAVLIGVGLFVAPAELVLASHSWVSELTRVALFSLTPVFAVVLEPYVGDSAGLRSRSGLAAALVAFAGTLCAFPVGMPDSIEAGGAFCAVILAALCVAAANCAAVRVACELPGISIAPMTAIAGGTAAIAFAAQSVLTERIVWRWNGIAPELAWAAGVELTGLLLLFRLMRRMTATRMTTRFVIAPIMTVLIGILLQRSTVESRTWLGLFLMAGGAGGVLFARDDETEGSSSLLKLDRN